MNRLSQRVQRLEAQTGQADGIAAVVFYDDTVTLQRWSGSKESMRRSDFERRAPDGRIDGQVYKAYIATDSFDPFAA